MWNIFHYSSRQLAELTIKKLQYGSLSSLQFFKFHGSCNVHVILFLFQHESDWRNPTDLDIKDIERRSLAVPDVFHVRILFLLVIHQTGLANRFNHYNHRQKLKSHSLLNSLSVRI